MTGRPPGLTLSPYLPAAGAFFSAVLLTLAFPLPGISHLSWIALVPLLLAVSGTGARESFFSGYFCGILWGLGALHWTYVYHPLSIFPVVLISAFYPGLFALTVNRLTAKMGDYSLFFTVPVVWTSLEYVRSLGFLGFPWLSLGYAHFRNTPLIQIASWTGVFGLSFITGLVNGALAASLKNRGRRESAACLLAALSVPVAVVIIGHGRIIPSTDMKTEPVRVAGIQTNFGIEESLLPFSPAAMSSIEALAAGSGSKSPLLIVFPETCVRDDIQQAFETDSWIAESIRRMAETTGSYLLLGGIRSEEGRVFNSAYMVSPEGEIIRRYDKNRLVPGGEYLPFFSGRAFFQKLFPGAAGYTPGAGLEVFEIPGARFSVLICFEGIFGDLARRNVVKDADFLVNITDDVWSNSKTSHYQHSSMSVFRSVENRVYLVRAGNTGISKVVNPKGVIEKELPWMERGFFVQDIHPKTGRGTFYSRRGDVFSRLNLLAGILLAAGLAGGAKRRRAIP